MNFVKDLRKHYSRRFSQGGEDGVITRVLEIVGSTNRFYLELGAGAGEECNTRLLRESGWTGVMLDCDYENPAIGLYREFITAENVNQLLAKYHVPGSFDVLSIDIDGNDYWVWKAISEEYRPRIVVAEFNAAIPSNIAVSMPYDPSFRWAGEPDVGMSLLALQKLGASKGYSLVYARPPNGFLVLRRLLPPGYTELSAEQSLGTGMALLLKAVPLLVRMRNKHWDAGLNRLPWVAV